MRFDMTFDEFKTEYIDNLNGYLPTYFTVDEEFNKPELVRVEVEMIAPFRMTDGPSRFFRVIAVVVNKEQYEQMKLYAENAGNVWKQELTTRIVECMNYAQTKF